MKRVLIVEDSRTQAEELRGILAGASYAVTVAHDGPSGAAVADRVEVDLVISDLVMPGFDGYELCRRLKAGATTKGVPVMLLTSRNEPLDVVRALEVGADNFVGKPFLADQLLTRVERTLRRAEAPERERVEMAGATFHIASGRGQVLDVLVSSLEDAAQRNAELTASKAAVDEAARQREQMLGVVAHELKNPLSAILMRARLEQQSPQAAARAKPLHDLVLRNAERMNVIIDDLLDMAKIESGSFDLHLERVNLSDLVAAVVDRHREVSGRAVELTLRPAVHVRADATRIEQVVANLLTNAFKYSPAGEPVAVKLDVAGARARVTVTDRGIGIEEAALARVFERYYRTEAGKSHAEGIGVGLYLCKLLVEQHTGKVGVASRPGEGSTFWFELPCEG